MNQITKEELSAYLPYNVKVKNTFTSTISTLIGISDRNNVMTYEDICIGNFNTIKLLLRPLSQLTTEIEVNGERFVPIDKLPIIGFESIDLISDIQTGWVRQKDFKLLLSWHFDVFGLIDRNLAEHIV